VKTEAKVGLLFFLGIGLALWFSIFIARGAGGDGEFFVRFQRILNLRIGDPVTYNGVRVGTVRQIDPEIVGDRALATVRFDLEEGVRNAILLNDETRFTITEGFLGGGQLNILTTGRGEPLTVGNVNGRVGEDPVGINDAIQKISDVIEENREDIRRAVRALPDAIGGIRDMGRNVSDLVEENRERVGEAIARIGDAADALDEILAENRTALKEGVENFGAAAGEVRGMVAENRADVRAAIERLPDAADRIAGLAADLREVVADNKQRIGSILEGIDRFVPKLNDIGDDLRDITGEIRGGEGSAHKLIYEEDLIAKAKVAIDSATQRLEEIRPVTEGFSQLKIYAGVRSGVNLRSERIYTTGYLRLEPRPWKFYEGGVTWRTAPEDQKTLQEDPDDFNVDFDLTLGWRFFPDHDRELYWLTARGGFIEGQLGGQVDVPLFDDDWVLSIMARDTDSDRNKRDRRYEGGKVFGRATLNVRVWDRIHLTVGGDDLLHDPGPFVGLRGELLDNDLRNIISVLGFMP